ncbi:MAG: response regulator [Calditrichaeota bacterium]|nr:response regulator [Calditrichota bacterium]
MRSEIAAAPRKVLIIDDDAVICEVAEALLHENGWTAAHALSPVEALSQASESEWPVILCDVHLPGDSGELLRQLRLRYPQSQVIMITGDPTLSSMRQAMQAGAYDYLLKPLRREELLRVTELAFDRHKLVKERDRLQQENERYREQLEEVVAKRTGQLRDSELRYRTLFDHTVDAIILVSLKTSAITELNATAARLLGGKSFNLQGLSIRDFAGQQLDHCFNSDSQESRRVWQIPNLILRGADHEEHSLSATVNLVELDGEVFVQIVARQTSDLAQLAQRADLMESELMNEQRLAAIGLLASGVAHNINTPLMGIYGIAQIIKMKHPDIQDIDGVISQVERINGIVRNLMWKSRQEQEQAKQDIDLNVLLQEELRFLEADMRFKHEVEKEYDFAPDLPPIFGRYSDFSQSFVNVIRNGLDAMYDCKMQRLRVSTSSTDDVIRVCIEDSGKGIANDHHEKIFEPFFTTKPAATNGDDERPTGTGLGLSTVKKLLTPYGCRFEVESTPERGTQFTILIPVEQNRCPESDEDMQDFAN